MLNVKVNKAVLPTPQQINFRNGVCVCVCVCVCRNVLIEIDENLAVRALIQVFTVCFLQRLTGQEPQVQTDFMKVNVSFLWH